MTTRIDPDDKARWAKVDAYISQSVWHGPDLSVDYYSVTYDEGGLYMDATVSIFVPREAYSPAPPPTLADTLADVAAALETVLVHFGPQMTEADRIARMGVLERAQSLLASAEVEED